MPRYSAAHALDREHHLLAVFAHADDDEERDGGRFAVEPHAHHGAVENEPHDRLSGQRAGVPRVPIVLHLAPGPAYRVLADSTAKQGGERTAVKSLGIATPLSRPIPTPLNGQTYPRSA